MTQTRLSITVVVSIVFLTSGCLGANQPADASDRPDGGLSIGAYGNASVVPLGEPVLVSTPNHRMSEFSSATDSNSPKHMIIGAMDWDPPDEAGTTSCAIFHTTDGGTTWAPGARIPGLDEPHLRGDPWVTIGPDGTAHMVCMELSNERAPSEAAAADTSPSWAVEYHSRSSDRGGTWAEASRIPTPMQNEVDKNSILALRDGSLVNCIWENGNGLIVTRSTDQGETWNVSVVPQAGKCMGLGEGPEGGVYMSVLNGLFASFDGGATWEPSLFNTPYTLNEPKTSPRNLESRVPAPGSPSFTVNPQTGSIVYVSPLWDAEDERWRAVLYRSDDRAATFEEMPFPATSSASCADCHVNYPLLTSDPHGRIALQYAKMSDYGSHREIWMTVSLDDGMSWLAPVLVSSTDNSYNNATLYAPRAPTQFAGTATYYATNPTDATSIMWPVVLTTVRDDHLRWGGDYWSITYSEDGFLSTWIEHDAEGTPQIWSRLIGVDQGP